MPPGSHFVADTHSLLNYHKSLLCPASPRLWPSLYPSLMCCLDLDLQFCSEPEAQLRATSFPNVTSFWLPSPEYLREAEEKQDGHDPSCFLSCPTICLKRMYFTSVLHVQERGIREFVSPEPGMGRTARV